MGRGKVRNKALKLFKEYPVLVKKLYVLVKAGKRCLSLFKTVCIFANDHCTAFKVIKNGSGLFIRQTVILIKVGKGYPRLNGLDITAYIFSYSLDLFASCAF